MSVEEFTGAVINLYALFAVKNLSTVTSPLIWLPEFTPPLVMSARLAVLEDVETSVIKPLVVNTLLFTLPKLMVPVIRNTPATDTPVGLPIIRFFIVFEEKASAGTL
jgi:hypothetical protein